MQHQSDTRHRSNLIPTRGQNDDTNRIDLAARTAWVDVTGAVNGWTQSCVGRSHPSEFAGDFGGCDVSDRTIDRPDESDSGHALLSGLNWGRFSPCGRRLSQHPGTASVIISTASLVALLFLGDQSKSSLGWSDKIRFGQAV